MRVHTASMQLITHSCVICLMSPLWYDSVIYLMPTVYHYNKHSVIFSLSCASTPFYKAGWFNETSLTHDSGGTASSVDLLAVSQCGRNCHTGEQE